MSTWLRIFMTQLTCFAVLLSGVLLGCFESFDPDARVYACDTSDDCLEGYSCVDSVCSAMPLPEQPDADASMSDAQLDVSADMSSDVTVAPEREDLGTTAVDRGVSNPCSGPLGACSMAQLCEDVCEDYCGSLEQCGFRCSRETCVMACEQDEMFKTSISQRTTGEMFLCPSAQLDNEVSQILDTTEPYNRVVSCADVCSDLQNNINPVDGERVCGEVSDCDLRRCQSECERAPALFGKNVDERVINRMGNGCPNNRILLPAIDDSSAVFVKNLCVPCNAICERLRPNSSDASSEWCGTRADDCPALATNEICRAQCEANPGLFHVDTATELCGNNFVTPWAGKRPELCGLQCDSLNHEWGQNADLTSIGPIIKWGNEQRYRIDEQTKICFGPADEASPDCEVNFVPDLQDRVEFRFKFTMATYNQDHDFGRYVLKMQAVSNDSSAFNQRRRVFVLRLEDSSGYTLLHDVANTIPPVESSASFQDTRVLHNRDHIMVSKRLYLENRDNRIDPSLPLRATEYEVIFQVTDIRRPSALVFEHIAYKIDVDQDLAGNDGTCQNQCFETSSDNFCDELCNPETGLMSLCGKTTAMPNEEGVPFTSHGDQPTCSSDPTDSQQPQFDTTSCRYECERNRCDLQFQINAIWGQPLQSTSENAELCKLLNFGGRDGWAEDQNANEVHPAQLCCLCSQDYCDAAIPNQTLNCRGQ